MLLVLCSPAAAGVGDAFDGVRSAAMGGAHTGIGTSNDTITANPAGMAIWPRYTVDLAYGYAGDDGLSRIGLTAVDSKSGPVAGGFAYTHIRGDPRGTDASLHSFGLAAAYPIARFLAFGIAAHHVRGSFNETVGKREHTKLFAGDLGIAAMLGGGVTLGFAYHNVVQSERSVLVPPAVELGASWSLQRLVVGADAAIDLRDESDRRWTFQTGAEYLVVAPLAARLGYERSLPIPGSRSRQVLHRATGGLGWVTERGGVDLTFQKLVAGGDAFAVMGALRFFL